jgi:hypothetical protein
VHDEYKEYLITEGVKTIMYPVTDLEKAKTLFGKLLGVEAYLDESYYVGFNVEGQDIGLDPHGHSKGMTGPVAYWHVDDVEERLKTLPRRRRGGAPRSQRRRRGQVARLRQGHRRQRHRPHSDTIVARETLLFSS